MNCVFLFSNNICTLNYDFLRNIFYNNNLNMDFLFPNDFNNYKSIYFRNIYKDKIIKYDNKSLLTLILLFS